MPPAILENSARAARTDLIHMQVVSIKEARLLNCSRFLFVFIIMKIEENLNRNQMAMSFNSMAWAHSTNMAPLEMARVQGERALLVVNAARRLQDRYLPLNKK